MRDVISSIVKDVVSSAMPSTRYGTVSTIDRSTSTCTVLFPGSTTPVPVKMSSLQPVRIGSIVRVQGIAGDNYVDDVVNGQSIRETVMRTTSALAPSASGGDWWRIATGQNKASGQFTVGVTRSGQHELLTFRMDTLYGNTSGNFLAETARPTFLSDNAYGAGFIDQLRICTSGTNNFYFLDIHTNMTGASPTAAIVASLSDAFVARDYGFSADAGWSLYDTFAQNPDTTGQTIRSWYTPTPADYWIGFSFGAGYTTPSWADPVACRLELDGTVRWRGALQKASGNFAQGNTVLMSSGTLPPQFRTLNGNRILPIMASYVSGTPPLFSGRVDIDNTGAMGIYLASPSHPWVSFDPVQYRPS